MSAEQRQLLDPGPAAPKKRQRRERDAYYSPDWSIDTFVERVPEARGGTLLDPCCGDGRMAVVLLKAGRFERVRLNDIDEAALARAAAAVDLIGGAVKPSRRDAADPALYVHRPDWTITNPPWDRSGQIAWTALQGSARGVALLLRITWLEPCAGREWLRRLPPTRMIALPRISYNGTGATDSATSAWFIWLRGPRGWLSGGIEVAGGDVGQEALAL